MVGGSAVSQAVGAGAERMWRPQLIVLQPTPYCNINCDYCYLQNRDDRMLMSDAVLAAVRDKVFARLAPDAAPTVVWHAGEPTVAPVGWYRRAYETLRAVTPRATTFSLQSNGVSLSDAWIDFLCESNTRIGLSIDGPQRFHDARRKTRAGGPTWPLIMRNLRRLQAANLHPTVISVLHAEALSVPGEYFAFYRDHEIHQISFSIDEAEGAHAMSSFAGVEKERVVTFLTALLKLAFKDGYSLYLREIERIALRLAEGGESENEQVEPWQVIVVAANGDVTTFSPEFMELRSPDYNNFRFGNILRDDIDTISRSALFMRAHEEIRAGVAACRESCRYFGVCGGGAPTNKMMENGSLASSETLFCRLSIQSAADALLRFISETRNAEPPILPTLASDSAPAMAR
jgi:uncharacterized protein